MKRFAAFAWAAVAAASPLGICSAEQPVQTGNQSGESTIAIAGDLDVGGATDQRYSTGSELVISDATEQPVVVDGAVQPAADWLSAGAARPPMSAGIRTIAPQSRFAGPDASNPSPMVRANLARRLPQAVRRAPVAASQPSEQFLADANVPTSGEQSAQATPEQLLIDAHERSQSARTQADLSQVVRGCAEAMRLGLDDETRKFALELSSWALNRRGQMRLDENQLDLAEADFAAAIEFDPQGWRAYHNRSVIYAQQGKFAESFDDVSRVIQLNPKFAKAFSNRATLYVQAGEIDRALADYDSALQADPQLAAALVGRGRLRHLRRQLDEALVDFDAATAAKPDDANIACSRADLLADLGRYRDAMQGYARAIQLNPRFEHAYRNGAWLLATCPDERFRDAEGALAGARKALEVGYGDRSAALDTLAAAQANAEQFDEAVKTIDEAIAVAPEETRPAYEARRRLYESGQPYRSQPVQEIRAAEYVAEG